MLFKQFNEPVIYKESTTMEEQINKLKEKNSDDIQAKLLEYGLVGEKRVLFELKNSHIGMYILHDVNIEYKDLKAQIDFIAITKNNVYVIECKNMVGNILIDNEGRFIRNITINNHKINEGLYSPLTQCERHIDLLKQLTFDRYNLFQKIMKQEKIDKMFIPVVVLANDKTILNDKYAPKEVKSKVIRFDQLISFIKTKDSKSESYMDEQGIKDAADLFLSHQINNNNQIKEEILIHKTIVGKNDFELKEDLRKYRYNKTMEEHNKPYFVFTDLTLNELVDKKPQTKDELLKINGLGPSKIEKYGQDIINIINQ